MERNQISSRDESAAAGSNGLQGHWPEYLMEAAELAVFMFGACVIVALVEHPASPVHASIDHPLARRAVIGIAMGLVAVIIVLSPFGQRSGAHLNPAVTLTYLRLGKIEPRDAVGYVCAHFIGALTGVVSAALLLSDSVIADPAVNYVATVPGAGGALVAFAAEALISFVLMLTVLTVSNAQRLNRYTALFAGVLVASFITIEAPLSGMSMNPARTLASALPGSVWHGLWIYFTAPVIGMLCAAESFVRCRGVGSVLCCKLHHENDRRCIFRCAYPRAPSRLFR